MTKAKTDFRVLTDEALYAFWEVIVRHYPDAKTGDLSPWTTIQLSNAAENAVDEWIDNNVPKHKR